MNPDKPVPQKKAPDLSPEIQNQLQPAGKIDPLLDCLVYLTSCFGKARSAEALRAGLPYDAAGMGPMLFCEAAERIGLKARIVQRRSMDKIPQAVLPAVLILKGGQACVLNGVKGSGKAEIFSPESGAVRSVSLKELEASYAGYAIFVHPYAEFNESAAPFEEDTGKHWFWGLVLESKGLYGRVLVAAVLTNLFALTSPIFIMTVYNRVIPNNAIATGWVLGIGALSIFVFDFVIRILRAYFIDLAGRKIDVVAARRLYDQLLNIKLAWRPTSSGAFANMLRDFDSLRDFMTSATMTAVVDLPFAIFFLAVIWMIGGSVALMLAGLIVIVVIAGMLLQIPLKALVRKSAHSAEAKHGILVESIYALETIKAAAADGRMRARYGHYVGENAALGQKSRFVSGLGVNIAAFVQQIASIIIVLMGMYFVQDNQMTIGALIACVMLGGRAIAPIGQVANLVTRYHQAAGSLKTLNEFMARPVERPPHRQFLHRPALAGKITFDRVAFVYPGTSRKVLESVSFTIEPGEKVGIVGRIGSGKSTIARLIMGLYDPSEGTLLVDDTDYRQVDPADLRRNVGYIAQDVVLFNGTVRDNITASVPHATEEEIFMAAREAGVHEFMARHPMGYDAPVGERGEGLSGGQRQAVALARAMLLKPNVLVCDEPTNAMDVASEEGFRRHVKMQTQGKTLVLITHRQPLLDMVNRLIVIDQGRVVADGSREDVIEALTNGKVVVPREAPQS